MVQIAMGNEWASREIGEWAEWILPVEKGCKCWKSKDYDQYCICIIFMQKKKEHQLKKKHCK